MQLYIHRDGQQFGPYTTEDAKSQLRQGALLPTDLAWYQGAPDWMPLASVPGMAVAPPPPPSIFPQPRPASAASSSDSSANKLKYGRMFTLIIGIILVELGSLIFFVFCYYIFSGKFTTDDLWMGLFLGVAPLVGGSILIRKLVRWR